ncbi:enoyl-CoA hydratase [Gordonia paraffinivorans]|uniref:enoyl-CoA hydratase/isomerase family protein n=1 Tax=Gordonia paraffinivorans TaxID=175628 RepID=UPI000D60DC92|nr:enoyl-CoA hydratase-related protein [Gordonia paraffinivorans]MBY4575459.1 enoyl-CoA hydratase [Gordonia paraffinivorans]PWD41355.1 enoyl-CoA hydratase [Gordonia paraffinivorans]
MSDVVLYEIDGPVATITLNRPDKLNALNTETVFELDKRVAQAAEDDNVKVVLIAANGRSFSAGFDINDEIEDGTETPLEWLPVLRRDSAVTMRIWSLPKPTIAVVQGYCLAGACEIAMACDMVVAADNAQFGEPEIQYGSGPVTLLMPFILGQKKTNELLFTGDKIGAEEALRLGLVNKVVPLEGLETAARELARRIAPTPLPILQLTKQALNRAYEAKGLRTAVNANIDISAIINGANTPEQQEFDKVAAEKGLKAALAWRDERYGAVKA